jgi:uncharacterized protein (DUF58 family)
VSPATRARLLLLAGGVASAAGVFLLWGIGVALLAAGLGTVVYGLLGIDVDRKPRG